MGLPVQCGDCCKLSDLLLARAAATCFCPFSKARPIDCQLALKFRSPSEANVNE